MLKRFIKDLRSKSKTTRNQVAMGAAVFVTAVVGAIWGYHIPDTFEEYKERQAAASDLGFGELVEQIRGQTSGLSDTFTAPTTSAVQAEKDTTAGTSTAADEAFAQYWEDYEERLATTGSETLPSASASADDPPRVTPVRVSPVVGTAPVPTTSNASPEPRAIRLVPLSTTSIASTSTS